MSICFKIEKLIESKGVVKTTLAKQLKVSRDTVYNWTDENIKVSVLQKLSDILDVDIMYFLSDNNIKQVSEPPVVYKKLKKKLTYKLSEIEKFEVIPDFKTLEITFK